MRGFLINLVVSAVIVLTAFATLVLLGLDARTIGAIAILIAFAIGCSEIVVVVWNMVAAIRGWVSWLN